MPERLNRVQIATARQNPGIVEICWTARDELLERVGKLTGGEAVIRKFKAVGASVPVKLDVEEKRLVSVVLESWLDEAGTAGLPDGLPALRNAMIDDVHYADRNA